ncbi:MAG TPA: ornithine carbamoyltransferase [Myxococcota bacterium]|jgi:ornithine carbamoyltransferase|nr:ornithine carbamoyltransferase [Myxococcota bacterium]
MAPIPPKRDLCTLFDLVPAELWRLVEDGRRFKRERGFPHTDKPLAGKTLAMVFEKASTRTRVSFEVAAFELGGHALNLTSQGSQLARGEPVRDTARVLSGYCHGIMVRTFGQDRVEEMAAHARVPVINGLSDKFHPCQILADLMTAADRFGVKEPAAMRGLKVAWIGDGNNVAHSWIAASALLGMEIALACPAGHLPAEDVLARARALAHGGRVTVTADPAEAARGAAVVNTDVWASMGQEDEAEARARVFAPYQVNEALVRLARPDAVVLHCLPAHRGEEITDAVMEGPRSAVWEQAENRLHVQKAVLAWLMGAPHA